MKGKNTINLTNQSALMKSMKSYRENYIIIMIDL